MSYVAHIQFEYRNIIAVANDDDMVKEKLRSLTKVEVLKQQCRKVFIHSFIKISTKVLKFGEISK